MSNFSYIFNLTDSSKSSFVVPPYTVNGPMTPSAATPLYNNTDTGVFASSANTTLVLVGKGIPEYGEVIQQDMLYLLEHFANPTRPQFPTEGQIWYKSASVSDVNNPSDPTVAGLYVWTGTSWQSIALSTPAAGSILDMNNNRIINLAAPVNPSDAVNLGTADNRYLSLTGGTVTGLTVFQSGAQSNVTPVNPTDLTTKSYVDTEIQSISISGGNYVLKGGDTITGAIVFSPAASLVFDTGTGGINFGNRTVNAMGYPVLATDGTNKQYVDTSIQQAIASLPPPTQPDGVVISGSLNSTTGILTLQRSAPLADVVISGAFAPAVHTQGAATVNVDGTQLTAQSVLQPIEPGGFTVEDAIVQLDQAIYQGSTPNYRDVWALPSAGSQYTMISAGSYNVAYNQVQVFVNGIKQYQTFRGTSTAILVFPMGQQAGLNALIGAHAGTYSVSVSVDGNTPVPLSITVSSTTTVSSLVSLLNQAFSSANMPCSVAYIGVSASAGSLVFASNASGLAAAGYQTVTFSNRVSTTTNTGLQPSSGFQPILFNPSITSTTSTGIPNTSATYTTTVAVDGGAPQTVTVTGSAVQTFGALASQLTAGLTGATVTVDPAGYLAVTSSSTGTSSSIVVTQGTLFTTTTIPSFQVISSPFPGTAGVSGNVGFTVAVDGVNYTISVSASTLHTFADVLSAINTALGTHGTAGLYNAGDLTITSATTGNGSSVVINSATDTLFAALPANNLRTLSKSIPGHGNSSITVSYAPGELLPSIPLITGSPYATPATSTYDWYETGVIGSTASAIRFTNPLPLGAIVEVTIFN